MKTRTKKRILGLILCFVMLIGIIPTTAFAANNSHTAHSKYVVHVDATEGNCTTPGNTEFWYCDYYTCRKYYADEAMTQEIHISDTIITPRVHSDACQGCQYTLAETTFELFVPSDHPLYNEDDYRNNGLHSLTPQLAGFRFLLVGEDENGNFYAMGNETNEDGSRQAVDITDKMHEDGSITVDSDTAEFFTYKEIPYSYTFAPDNGYMSVMDCKIVVHGQNIKDVEDALAIPQSIRFEQDKELSDFAEDKGYFFAWDLNSGLILFDSGDAEHAPKFAATPMSTEENNDHRAHTIMLYMERCEHPNMKYTAPVEVTCTEAGNLEYWYCEDCRMYFSDAQGTTYVELPEGMYDYEAYLHTPAWGHSYDELCVCENCGEPCPHTNAYYFEQEESESSCFEPGRSGYWHCDECWRYLDKNKEHTYWEEWNAAVNPATGHAFNIDTGTCDHCGIPNPVYSKVTSLDDVNEEDLYIVVAEVEEEGANQYFALGGLGSESDEQGVIWCNTDSGNAIPVIPNADGTISLLHQNYTEDVRPSEMMLDINPEQFDCGLYENYGLTTVMPKLPNHCVYPFQSTGYDYTGFMGVARFGNGEYGRWDGMDWVIDFYTTEVNENTYREEGEGLTHAEQVECGNIDEHITEGNLLLYNSSFTWAGGAMFTLRLREYDGKYYFICGEDWALEGAGEWDPTTGKVPTNDKQYAVSLYRYDIPAIDIHKCDFSDWVADVRTDTHTRICMDPACGKTETKPHIWDEGAETKSPNCTEEGVMTYACLECGSEKTESIPALDHDWESWSDAGENAPADIHTHTCQRKGCGVSEQGTHQWSDWTELDDKKHKKTCAICNGERTVIHKWDEGNVINWATHLAPGEIHFTCIECGYIKIGELPILEEHEWTKWSSNEDGTHSRTCICMTSETLPHNWSNWEKQNSGEYKRTCVDCEIIETMVLDEEKPVNTTINNAVANTNFANTDIELIDMVLTDNEQSQVAKGAEVKVYLKVEDISNEAPDTHKSEAEAKVDGGEIGMYLDIDLFKQVGNATESQVEETSGAVTITITIPDNLINVDASVTRTYKIIRVHEDGYGNLITDVIEGKFNPEDNSFTFETDKFSTYALAYADACQHNYKNVVNKATFLKDGNITLTCTLCGDEKEKNTIKSIKTVNLSKAICVYTGKEIAPEVIVTDAAGKKLRKNIDYTVVYSAGRKKIGTYTVTVVFKNNYSGVKKLTYKIIPKTVAKLKVKALKKQMQVSWKKDNTVSGYEIVYATSKNFKKGKKTVKIKTYKTYKKAIKKLTTKKTYYVKVRAYKKVGKTTYYSDYTAVKKIKIK